MHGPAYRFVLFSYNAMRKVKNRLLNLIEPPLIVLLYHRVATLSADPQMIAVTPENFRNHMRYLKDSFSLVRFEEDWARVKRPAVAVTFDDGYADNARDALPILEEVGVPATFFICTGNIGTRREFWWYELESIILDWNELPERFELHDTQYGRIWKTSTLEQRKAMYHDIHLLMLEIETWRREQWLDQLRNWSGRREQCNESYRAMTVGELKMLSASAWTTVGAHTVMHTPLSRLDRDSQRREITESRKQLEEWLGHEVNVFSYPYGGRCHYNRETLELCREAGFSRVAANFPGQAHRWTDPLQIPRQVVRNWDIVTFAAMMKRFMYQ